MAIQYNLTAADILRTLGYTEETGRAELEAFEQENNIKLPPLLSEFLSLRSEIDLMETSDIWQIPYFSYEDIEERIEEDKEYWEENPDECEGDEFYEFSQIPREQWSSRVPNYLQIGSDYAAGVVNFGICIHDLEQDNPPVYVLNEDNSLCDWEPLSETLSEFLMCIVGDVLSCQDYNTAIDALEENGWSYHDTPYASAEEAKNALLESGIDLSALEQAKGYGRELYYSCCYDNEKHILYFIKAAGITYNVYKIAK